MASLDYKWNSRMKSILLTFVDSPSVLWDLNIGLFQCEEKDVGQADSQMQMQEDGHQGDTSHKVTSSQAEDSLNMQPRSKRKLGQSKDNRTLGDVDKKVEKRLKTVNSSREEDSEEKDQGS